MTKSRHQLRQSVHHGKVTAIGESASWSRPAHWLGETLAVRV
jgi:hypothetical protein